MNAMQIEGWYKVEQVGRNVHIGLCDEVTVLGQPMLRINTPELPDSPPDEDGYYRKGRPAGVTMIAPATLFRLTPISEAAAMVALMADRSHAHAPRQMLSGPTHDDDYNNDDDNT